MKLSDLLERVDQLIKQGMDVMATKHHSASLNSDFVDMSKFGGFRAALLSFLMNVYGKEHPYYFEVDRRVQGGPSDTEKAVAILESIRHEMSGGWLVRTKSLITAEVFSDFIEMADYLLSEGYKDPSAVLIGSVLEEHLRQLCQLNGIPTEIQSDGKLVPKKADVLNADLTKAGVYNKLDQKAVTAWLDLRNKAAHGYYTEYNSDQVKLMYQGVLEFMTRTSG